MFPIDFHFAGTLVLYRIPIDRHAPNNFDIVKQFSWIRDRWIWTVHRCTPLRDGSDGGSSLIQYQFSNGSELCGFFIWASKWWSSLIRYGMLNGSILLWNWSKCSGFIQSGSQMEVLFDMGRGQVTDWSISTTWYIHLHSIYITWWSNFTEDLEREKVKFLKLTKKVNWGF